MGRMEGPHGVVFIASAEPSYMTRAELIIDGGKLSAH